MSLQIMRNSEESCCSEGAQWKFLLISESDDSAEERGELFKFNEDLH